MDVLAKSRLNISASRVAPFLISMASSKDSLATDAKLANLLRFTKSAQLVTWPFDTITISLFKRVRSCLHQSIRVLTEVKSTGTPRLLIF